MKKLALTIAIAGVCVGAGAAVAQPTGNSDEELSEGTAIALSLGGTVVSYSLIIGAGVYGSDPDSDSRMAVMVTGVAGAYLAPSFGHWYAGKYFTRGLAIRTIGGSAAMLGLAMAFEDCPPFAVDGCSGGASILLMAAGGTLAVIGTFDDLFTASGRVRRHNARLRDVTLVPTVTPGGGGGLVLAGRF